MLKGVVYLFFACLLVLSGQKLGTYAFDLYQQGKASEDWILVNATMESFEFNSHKRHGRKNGGQTQNPHVEVLYRYEYDGLTYTGDRTGFGPYSKGQLNRPKRGVAQVYENPEKPSESVYIKGVSKPNLGALAFAIGLGLAGLCLAYLGLRGLIRK